MACIPSLVISSARRIASISQGFFIVRTVFVIHPAVFQRQAHAVKHKAVKQFCTVGHFFEGGGSYEQLRYAVKAELFCLVAVKIVE